MKKIDVLLGLQWGDEGKGKIVDVLTPEYDVIARFQGGPNAGHSLNFNNIKHILHTIPSGVFHKKAINIIGNGVVIDPVIFEEEIHSLNKLGVNLKARLFISKKAHLILPSHRILDAASEASMGKARIGSTLKGISPAYMDKTGRSGLRVGDINTAGFKEKYCILINKHKQILKQYNYSYDLSSVEKQWFKAIELMSSYNFVDTEHLVNKYIQENKAILAEGAQGTLLDIDFGSYPFVTSSNTICAGACTGLGIAPDKIGEVYGIFKAYCTRVGSGPFPTELLNETGKLLQKYGNEFGATTGRPRRCGWLDLTALKYAVMLNGVSNLIITKLDVLSYFDTIKVSTAYKTEPDGTIIDYFPFNLNEDIKPIYKEFQGWKKDISNCTNINELPKQVINYIEFIEKEVNVPVKIISVGADRKQTLYK